MIDSNINKYIDNNDVLEIYSKSRDNFEFEDFILGFIVSEKDNYLLVETIDDSGLLDSYTLLLKTIFLKYLQIPTIQMFLLITSTAIKRMIYTILLS
ncbi:hypothetical protein AKUG0410_14740 [Apilactobacillus kunkeei]|nr:hypothetical protein AKUG0412_14950 [Apilactobacillus kunkeei]CAI2697868.1 hypothetical protein AKUG0410_14740 [Apilactobacillus kunkeei]